MLEVALERIIKELAANQTENGYLGVWLPGHVFKQNAPKCPCATPWDAWGHNHVVVGLLEFAASSDSDVGNEAVGKVVRMLVERFGDNPTALHALGAHHTVAALLSASAKAFAAGIQKDGLLTLINAVLKLQDMPGGGDYIKRGGSEAAPTFEHNRVNAWHGLVTLEGMAVLAGVPGASNAEGMRKAVTKLWWSLCERERRNTGALFSGDKAGNSASNSKEASKPQVAAMWAKLSTAVLALSGNSVVVDELELTLYNAGLFLMASASKWRSSTIPSEGQRSKPAATLSEEALAGPCIMGIVPDCSVTVAGEGMSLNMFAPGTYSAKVASGTEVSLVLDTQYPYGDGAVDIVLKASRRGPNFPVNIRIPSWSKSTKITVDLKMGNQPVTVELGADAAGKYYALDYSWSNNDQIKIEFDFSLRFWKDAKTGNTSIYRGPILLAYVDPVRKAPPPKLKAATMQYTLTENVGTFGGADPCISLEFDSADGKSKVVLCDYASVPAGQTFTTWLAVDFEGQEKTALFSQSSPSRTFTVATALEKSKSTIEAPGPAPPTPIAKTPVKSGGGARTVTRRKSLSELLQGLGIEDNTKQFLTTRSPDSKTATLWKRPPASASAAAASPATPKFVANDDLADARAMQKSLRKEKADLQFLAEKGTVSSGVGFMGATPQSAGRKASMRNMLSDTLSTGGVGSGSPAAAAVSAAAGSNRMSFGFPLQSLGGAGRQPGSRRSSSDLTRSRSYDNALDDLGVGEDEEVGYELATAEEIEAPAEPILADPTPIPQVLTVKRSWRKPWKKVTVDQFGNKVKSESKKSKRKSKAAAAAATSNAAAAPAPRPSVAAAVVANPKPAPTAAAAAGPSPSWPLAVRRKSSLVPPSSPLAAFPGAGVPASPLSPSAPSASAVKPSPFGATAQKKKSSGLGVSEKCHFCGKSVYAMEKAEADGLVFHKTCLRCSTCNKALSVGKYAALEGKIYCKVHFKQLFKLKGNYNEGFGMEQHKHKWDRKTSSAAAGEADGEE